MKTIVGVAAALAAAALAAVMPTAQLAAMPTAQANNYGTGAAEKVRKLDIMLMVSSLRCRKTSDNFQSDYEAFSASHLAELNQASRTLKSDLALRYGASGADRALDRLSTSMANQYGQGHPWLDCHGLKEVTHQLANNHNPGVLLNAADDLLASQGDGRTYLAARY
ncbi:MAG TPA: S-adenosyl-L-homocysteine hydrolase [Sphingomonadaceae bacterium]